MDREQYVNAYLTTIPSGIQIYYTVTDNRRVLDTSARREARGGDGVHRGCEGGDDGKSKEGNVLLSEDADRS